MEWNLIHALQFTYIYSYNVQIIKILTLLPKDSRPNMFTIHTLPNASADYLAGLTGTYIQPIPNFKQSRAKTEDRKFLSHIRQ